MASNDIPTIVHEPSLLGIPSELRLRIFEHVFPGLRIHYANPTGLKLDGIPEEEFRWVTEHKYNIGVLTVCKNLSREASAVFASSLSLSVRMRENLVWSQTIVQYSSYIRSLEINLTEFFGEDIELSIFPHLQVLVLDCDTFEGEGFGDFSTIEAYQEVLEGSVDEKVKENFKAFMLARPWISRVHEQPSRSFRILLIAHQYLSPRLLKPRAGAWMVSDYMSGLL